MLACQRAVKPHLHEASRAQQAQQQTPAVPRISKMMQDTGYVDEIERTAESFDLRDVCLRELDVANAELLRHAFRVTEAREAQIDGEDWIPGMHGARSMAEAGAPPGDQHIASRYTRQNPKSKKGRRVSPNGPGLSHRG